MLKQLRRFFPGDEWLPAKRPVTGKEGEWWKKLHRGSKLTFGQMSQAELSSQELFIGDTCRYDFGSAHFVAYVLERMGAAAGDAPVAQIIVADGRREECYLAISRKLDVAEQSRLLDDSVLAEIASANTPERIHIRAAGAVTFATWAVEAYRKQIHGIRGKKTIGGRERFFEYALFVSPNNERAIEIEQYEDGTRDMYLTIYRPASDITSIFHATRFEAVEKGQPSLVKSDTDHAADGAFAAAPTLMTTTAAVKEEPERISGSGLADIRAQIQLTVEQEREKLRMQHTTTTLATTAPTPAAINPSADKAQVEVVTSALDVVVNAGDTPIDIPALRQDNSPMVASVTAAVDAVDAVAVAPIASIVVPALMTTTTAAVVAEKVVAQDNHEVLARIAADMADIADVAAHSRHGQDESSLSLVMDEEIEEEENAEEAAHSTQELMRTLQDVAAAVDADDEEENVVIAGNAPSQQSNAVQIDCHIRVAARIIDEALRRDMRLEDVVRKALGLPIAPEEKVSFTMNLSEKEYQDLAERFECSPKDKQAIHAAIVEDLIDFSGERARLDALKPVVKTANS